MTPPEPSPTMKQYRRTAVLLVAARSWEHHQDAERLQAELYDLQDQITHDELATIESERSRGVYPWSELT